MIRWYVTFAYQAESVPTLKGAGGERNGLRESTRCLDFHSAPRIDCLARAAKNSDGRGWVPASSDVSFVATRDCTRFSCSVCEGGSSFKGGQEEDHPRPRKAGISYLRQILVFRRAKSHLSIVGGRLKNAWSHRQYTDVKTKGPTGRTVVHAAHSIYGSCVRSSGQRTPVVAYFCAPAASIGAGFILDWIRPLTRDGPSWKYDFSVVRHV